MAYRALVDVVEKRCGVRGRILTVGTTITVELVHRPVIETPQVFVTKAEVEQCAEAATALINQTLHIVYALAICNFANTLVWKVRNNHKGLVEVSRICKQSQAWRRV